MRLKPIAALRASFVVTLALSACGGGSRNSAGPDSSEQAAEDQWVIAQALKSNPACPADIEDGQPCSVEPEEACVQTDGVGPCGPLIWYCQQQQWQQERVSCNPPEAFED